MTANSNAEVKSWDTLNLAAPALLQKIDKLFACNVGEHIDLPQLVVVGDQSSGKSSILDGLTNLAFPRDSGLCTRFATQIVFRRSTASEVTIVVSIIPSQDASEERAAKARAWSKTGLSELDSSTFTQIMKEAEGIMGIGSSSDSSEASQSFSDDVLRLEIAGPNQAHLSVIDVPGIFKKTTEGVTTKADMHMVRKMVEGYMKNPRSVMLAVIPANVDIATQEILDMAEEYDKEGSRTLGVLTKPDLVDHGAEHNVLDLLDGTKHRLRLGWHIVKNPSQHELQQFDLPRKLIESTFFDSRTPWSKIEKDKIGIAALQARLQEVLTDHIRAEFPQVKSEIMKRLKQISFELTSLGAKRDTEHEQRAYLVDIASQFQAHAQSALSANYSGTNLFSRRPELKLATIAVMRGEIFAKMMARKGLTYRFGSKSEPPTSTLSALDSDAQASDEEETGSLPFKEGSAGKEAGKQGDSNNQGIVEEVISDKVRGKKATQPAVRSAVRLFTNSGDVKAMLRNQVASPKGGKSIGVGLSKHALMDLNDILHPQEIPIPPVSDGIMTWLKDLYETSRGFELGSFNPSILAVIMTTQSVNWVSIAKGYISDIVLLVHHFFHDILSYICPNDVARSGLVSLLTDPMHERYKRALAHVDFVLDVERTGTPATYNHYFNENLQKARQARTNVAAAKKAFVVDENAPPVVFGQPPRLASKVQVIRLHDLTDTTTMDNADSTVQDIHDILQSYYKIARKRFVDIVSMQGADWYLLTGPDTPLKVFTSAFVAGLTREQLEEIAGEAPGLKRRRAALLKEMQDLEAGRKILMA